MIASFAFFLFFPDAPATEAFVFVTPGYCQIFVRNLFCPSLTLPARKDFAYLRIGVGFRVRCSRVPARSYFFLYFPEAPATDKFVFVTPGYCQIFVRNLFCPSLTLPARIYR